MTSETDEFMTEDEFVELVLKVYEQLLLLPTTTYTNAELLQKVLDSGEMFRMQVTSDSSGTPFRQAFTRIGEEIDRRNVSTKNRRELDVRIREVLTNTIEKWKAAEKKSEIDKERTRMLPKEDMVRSLLADVAVADKQLLLAGLGYLVRDMDEYLSAAQPDYQQSVEAEKFLEVIGEMKDADKKEAAATSYAEFKRDESGPRGMAEEASRGRVDLSPLLTKKVVSKPATSAGRKFFNKFKKKLKVLICDEENGPYGQLRKGLISQAAVPTTIATTILSSGFSAHTVWYPLTIYVALLVAQAGLDAYCDKKSNPKMDRAA